jgi:hypothetical protein
MKLMDKRREQEKQFQAGGGNMKMRSCTAALIMLAVVSISLGKTPRLSGEPQGAKQDLKSAGHDTEQAAKKTDSAVTKTTKKAAHDTEQAAKKTDAAVEKTSKKTAHESAQAAKTTGKTVEDSTATATHKSVHGLKKATTKVEGKTASQ